MGRYSQINTLKDSDFRRLTGVKQDTFRLMVSDYKEELARNYKRVVCPSKLSAEDKVLMILE